MLAALVDVFVAGQRHPRRTFDWCRSRWCKFTLFQCREFQWCFHCDSFLIDYSNDCWCADQSQERSLLAGKKISPDRDGLASEQINHVAAFQLKHIFGLLIHDKSFERDTGLLNLCLVFRIVQRATTTTAAIYTRLRQIYDELSRKSTLKLISNLSTALLRIINCIEIASFQAHDLVQLRTFFY